MAISAVHIYNAFAFSDRVPKFHEYDYHSRIGKFKFFIARLSLLVFYVTFNDISVIYVTAEMCRRTEEVVPTVWLPTP